MLWRHSFLIATDAFAFAAGANAGNDAPDGMVWIPGGEFSMGAAMNGHGSCEMAMPSNDAEPIRRVRVNGFWMDKTVVTNDPAEPNEPKHAHRGGSFLCNDQYCSRYIVGTRRKSEVNTGPNHLSFRCVKSARQDPQPIAIKSKN